MKKQINARGKSCPIPVLMAKEAIAAGETEFAIEVDTNIAVENLKRLAASQGFFAAVHEKEGFFTLHFVRTGEAAPDSAPGGSYVILVGRDVLGEGDRELGTILMRMFFYTLTSSSDLPSAILFLNDGVKLPTLDDQVVEHLTALSAAGVEVLVCGTCLNFNGLTDRLRVGTASNMYDILTRMQAALKVISL